MIAVTCHPRINRVLLSIQQLRHLGNVRHIGGSDYHAVYQPRRGVDTNVDIYPEVPLIAFFRQMHLRIVLAFSVLDRGRRGNEGSIDNGAFLEQRTLVGQMLADRFKQHSRQLMGFQQATESQQGGGIRRRLMAQVDADKNTNGLAVLDGRFGALIGEPETLLHDIHTQHARQTNCRAPTFTCGVAVERCYLRLQ